MTGEEAFLSIHEETMIANEKTGEVTQYTVYEIWNEDDDGIPYDYKVKPMRESDKAKLNVILQKRALAVEKLRQAAEQSIEEKGVRNEETGTSRTCGKS